MKLSICMMVKNEELNLERCLNSLKNLRSKITNELIIVDTGSTDRTMEIAKLYDVKLYEHKWNNNFSEMRNISISYAKGEWLMIIDADEELVEDKALIKQLGQDNIGVNAFALELENIVSSDGKKGSKIVTMRLFKNDGKFHYKGVVHNTPIVNGTVLKVDALLNHYGYVGDDADLMETKFERTSKLLIQELEKDPQNVYYLYQLGTTYDMHKEDDKALEYYEKAYVVVKNDPTLCKEHFYLYGSYAKVLATSNRYEEAVRISNEGLLIQKDYIDLMYFGGLSNLILKNYTEGIKLVKDYLNYIDGVYETNIFDNPNVQLYTIYSKNEVLVNLATTYLTMGNFEESIKINTKLLKSLDENSEYIEKCVNNYIVSCVENDTFMLLRDLYAYISQEKWNNIDVLIYTILKNKESISIDSRNYIISQSPSYLGKLFKYFFGSEVDNDNIIDFDLQKNKYFISNGVSEIVLFSIQLKKQCEELFLDVDEMKLMSLFGDLIEMYEVQLIELLRAFVDDLNNCQTYERLYLRRIILKILALHYINLKSNGDYFEMYIDAGLDQISYKYSASFINQNIGNQYLNSEEQYFSILYNIKSKSKIQLLYDALNIFPDYERLTLKWVEKYLDAKKVHEAESLNILKSQLKLNLQQLIELGEFKSALILIDEYMTINPYDIEMLLIKSELQLEMNR